MPDDQLMTSPDDLLASLLARAAEVAVIWDFDGVVADTEPLQDASYRILAEQRGWSPSDGYFLDLVGRTEDDIWGLLVADGFPLVTTLEEELDDLKAERKQVFVSLTSADLSPTWVATLLMPALASVAREQIIVSNGDPEVITILMRKWGLLDLVTMARRDDGADKTALLERYCSTGSVLIEDNAGWLAMGRRLGAVTVGVLHGYNKAAGLEADYLTRL